MSWLDVRFIVLSEATHQWSIQGLRLSVMKRVTPSPSRDGFIEVVILANSTRGDHEEILPKMTRIIK